MSKRKKLHLKMVDRTFIHGQDFHLLLEVALTGKLRDSSLNNPRLSLLVEDDLLSCDDPDISTFFLLSKGKEIVANASVLFAAATAALAQEE